MSEENNNSGINAADKKRELLKKLLSEKVQQSQQVPASCAQSRLWIVNRIEAPNPSYNIPAYVTLTGRLNVDALEKSLNLLVQRHASLRTTFKEEKGQPFQIIAPRLYAKPLAQIVMLRSETLSPMKLCSCLIYKKGHCCVPNY